jgi:hypothetical protein
MPSFPASRGVKAKADPVAVLGYLEFEVGAARTALSNEKLRDTIVP